MATLANLHTGRSGAIRITLVGGHIDCQAVRATLDQIGDPRLEVSMLDPAEARLAGDGRASEAMPPPDVTMVLFAAGGEEDALNYLEGQAGATPAPALFALMRDPSSALMRRILQAGADEILFMPLEAGDVTRALLKVSERRRRTHRDSGGMIISLASLTGGVGVSSLAVNLALAIRRRRNQRVALVDLDLQSGALAGLLNLEPERSVMRLCEPERKLDSMLLESALTKHPAGIYLLAAPPRIEDGDRVSDQVVAGALELIRQIFDFVIVDCGRVDENAVAAWERSDHLLYLIDQSIAAVRGAWRFLELFGRLGIASVEPEFILSRYQARHPLTAARLASTLGRPLFARIPRDEKTLERAQLFGRDLWEIGARAPLTRAVEALSLRLTDGESAGTHASGIVTRFFSAVGAAH